MAPWPLPTPSPAFSSAPWRSAHRCWAPLFLTEVALGLASRFVPQANVFVVGLPVEVLVALLAVGSALVFLRSRLEGLLDAGLRTGVSLFV